MSAAALAAGQPPAAGLFVRQARAFGLNLTDPFEQLGCCVACEQALTSAGFVDVSCAEGTVRYSQGDLDRAWDVMERMRRGELSALPSAERGRLRASYLTELDLAAHVGDGRVPCPVGVGIADGPRAARSARG